MEKRYQVFISSTFQDLQNARQEVSQALLRADCFPAGMELFPAADEEQFAFIKTVIDQSDYYIIISAGRYGSIHPGTGVSYTEMEYDYAVETGKPVIRLLHKDPFNELRGEFIEKTDKGKARLENFRRKMMESTLIRFWEVPKELGIEVLVALTDLKRRNNAIGWVRADKALEADEALEISRVRKRLDELQRENEELEEENKKFTLSSDGDKFNVPLSIPAPPENLKSTLSFLSSICNSSIEDIHKILADCIIWIENKSQRINGQYDIFTGNVEFQRSKFIEETSKYIEDNRMSAQGVIVSLRADNVTIRVSEQTERFKGFPGWAHWAGNYLEAYDVMVEFNTKTPPQLGP